MNTSLWYAEWRSSVIITAQFICRSYCFSNVASGGIVMLKRGVMAMCAAMAVGTSAASQLDPSVCKASGSLMRLNGLPEASGLVASRATPGRLWSHNDSGTPELIAFDAKGNISGRVSITGARVEDWEALASAPCGKGNCLYVADIGDNDGKRRDISIYRVPEPAQATMPKPCSPRPTARSTS
jgi:hypothetical protein